MNKNLLEVLKSDFIKDMDIEIFEWFRVDEDTELQDFKGIDEIIGGYVLEGNFEKLKEYIVDTIIIDGETLKKAYIYCGREVN